MRNVGLILLSIFGALACSGKRLHIGDDGAGGGHAGTGAGQAGTGGGPAGSPAGAAGSIMPSGAGGSGGATGRGVGGTTGGTGTGGTGGTSGIAGAIGTGGTGGASNLSVDPSSATFASMLVEAVSAAQTFTVRNDGNAPATTTAALAALAGTNAADFSITSNDCGTTLQPGASCQVAVAFAPKTRSGSRTANLTVGAASGAAANVSLSGTALPSLGLLAGTLGGAGNVDGTASAAHFTGPGGVASDGAGSLFVTDGNTIRKVVVATGAVTTFAGAPGQPGSVDGTGAAARFTSPYAVAGDGAGNLYVADNCTIRKVVVATAAVTTLAGAAGQCASTNGTGAAARFNGPSSIASDGAGNIYVTDGNAIRRIVLATAVVSAFAGAAAQTGTADGTGAAARFNAPAGIAADGAGNLLVADSTNETIRKIVIGTRAVTTLAGGVGLSGSADGTGTAARFNSPGNIVSDGAGNIYISDYFNNTIRKIVIATGAVTTVAGAPRQYGSTDGTGTAARFAIPNGIATDGAGSLFVADSGNNSIRRIAIATGAVTTLAGAPGRIWSADEMNPGGRLNDPNDVVSDGAGTLYVADTNNHLIRKVDAATGTVTTLAGGSNQGVVGADGTGADASFFQPGGLALDGAGNLYVADTSDDTIRKIVIATGAVTTVAGLARQQGYSDGTGAAARFAWPQGVALDGAGNLYVTDTNNRAIRKIVLATGAVTTLAGGGPNASGFSDGTGTNAYFAEPTGVTSDGAGNLYVTDTSNAIIRQIVIATGEVITLAGSPTQYGSADGTGADARFFAPWDIAYDGAGNLYVADSANNTVRKLVIATGAVTTLIGMPGWGLGGYADGTGANVRFAGPSGIAVDPGGDLVIADAGNNAIRQLTLASGAVTTVAGAPTPTSADGTGPAARFTRPSGIAGDGAGNLYITDGNDTVRKIVVATKAVATLAGAQSQRGNVDATGLDARFYSPYGIIGDLAGSLYVVDGTTLRRIALATGAVTTLAGTPSSTGPPGGPAPFTWPTGIVSDGSGNLYVSDSVAFWKVDTATGTVTTVQGAPSHSPEDAPPFGLAIDGTGTLYYPNFGSIQKLVIATGTVTTLAGGSGNGSVDGIGAAAQFSGPSGVASDGAGTLYVADGNTIRKIVTATGAVSTVIGSPDRIGVSLGALPASLGSPRGVFLLPTGELAIVDNAENAVLIAHF